MELESGAQAPERRYLKSYRTTLLLAYQSFGVVYGDLSTSPIYVYKSTFSGKLQLHEQDAEVLGVLSLVFWTLTLIPLLKYIVFVLGADDNGEGGTFALYSLMCRNSKMGLLNNFNTVHDHLSVYRMETSQKETKTSVLIKNFFEKHQSSRIVLLLVVLLGVSMVIGDGVLTPTMSVLSAVSGIRIKVPNLHENYMVFTACIVLMALFALQHYGTHRVGFLFAPILIAWLCCISGIGIYNIIKWNPGVVRAVSPYYIYNFFKLTGKDGWSSLGGIVLCITGAEAMFADLGHFSKFSIRMAFTAVVYPCLVLAYMGEAAYLTKHNEDLQKSFYESIPEQIFWPVFVIATLATAVGSQAIISATFSIISQCRALGCFPRVKIIHTSSSIHGQIYIPEVNWLLMFLCLVVTIGFKNTDTIGNAYGLAVIIVMFVTTCLMFLIIVTIWKRTVFLALLFIVFFGSLELLYFSACLTKVHNGGWLPLVFALLALIAMSAWHYGTSRKQSFELQNKVCLDQLLSLGPSLGLVRVPGIGLIYTTTVTGIPPMFAHFVTNFPAFHRVCVFVCLQTLTVPKVLPDEQFLIGRIGPPEYHIFQCIVRYGYKDLRWDSDEFENQLLLKIAEFLQRPESNGEMSVVSGKHSDTVVSAMARIGDTREVKKKVRFRGVGVKQEVKELIEEKESGVAYMMGHTCVVAHESSSFIKKFTINVIYGFLRRNSRRPAVALGVPHTSLIEVGMLYIV
ncbi:probable potassium transporter 13 [Dioscorea cayenensis subsp. rotundata]|uniref:Potassium transporter n=1 Tax=Dioscorea cayennensis subsp. rotundata TaxID=55577 RepID=A0AB40BIC0_DIOCR|nr:probable potassium transporter 13 [Dioscorea cayenensis subsp. rotundata]